MLIFYDSAKGLARSETDMATAPDQPKPKPIPYPDDPVTQPFWAAARENRLAIQHCNTCGCAYHPPVGLCENCASDDLGVREVSGRGSIYSYTIVHSQRVPAFDRLTPFVIGRVELEDAPGVFVIANLLSDDGTEPSIGQAVMVEFEEISAGVKLPQFRLVPEPKGGPR
jgi:uncharacterized OB-fold protein